MAMLCSRLSLLVLNSLCIILCFVGDAEELQREPTVQSAQGHTPTCHYREKSWSWRAGRNVIKYITPISMCKSSNENSEAKPLSWCPVITNCNWGTQQSNKVHYQLTGPLSLFDPAGGRAAALWMRSHEEETAVSLGVLGSSSLCQLQPCLLSCSNYQSSSCSSGGWGRSEHWRMDLRHGSQVKHLPCKYEDLSQIPRT